MLAKAGKFAIDSQDERVLGQDFFQQLFFVEFQVGFVDFRERRKIHRGWKVDSGRGERIRGEKVENERISLVVVLPCHNHFLFAITE